MATRIVRRTRPTSAAPAAPTALRAELGGVAQDLHRLLFGPNEQHPLRNEATLLRALAHTGTLLTSLLAKADRLKRGRTARTLVGQALENAKTALAEDYEDLLESIDVFAGSYSGSDVAELCGGGGSDPGWMAIFEAELLDLDRTHGPLQYNHNARELELATAPFAVVIPHEDIDYDLGTFTLSLRVHQTGNPVFRAVPEQRPDEGEYAHPNVDLRENDFAVCLGDNNFALVQTALREGRISDAFLLARSVLTTYSARGYIALEDLAGEGPAEDDED